MVREERELWVQCVDWLLSTGILEHIGPECRLVKPADLAAILRDGILLCELVLKLCPGCIDRQDVFLLNRKSPFMCSKNISLFLNACQQHFGLTELFNYNDLYDLEDFERVLKVLSNLSHSHRAKQFGLRPFPMFSHASTSNGDCFQGENTIYCNLREEVEELASSAEEMQYDLITNFQGAAREKKREELYDSILTQRTPKIKVVSTKYAEYKPTNEKSHCAKELLDTESNYCEVLSIIIDNFYTKLKFKLTTEDHQMIFMNIESIYHVHKEFLNKLTPAVLASLSIDDPMLMDDKENYEIADVFLHFKLSFVAYGTYCSLLKSSQAKLEELERTKPETKKIINDMSNVTNKRQFKLQDLLVVPMQRLLKYSLLLKILMKNTTDVAEHSKLDSALEAMNDINNYVNEMKRDHEAIEVIHRLRNSVVMPDGTPPGPFSDYGRLLEDGMVKLTDFEGGLRAKQRYVFLFEKLLMICKQQKTGIYEFRRSYFFTEFELVEGEPEVSSKTSTLSRKLTASFFDNTVITLVRKGYRGDSSTASSLQLQFKSFKQRDEWKEKVKNAIEINNPSMAVAKGHSLLYKSYTSPTSCCICRKLLAGKFYQGYHCSGCNKDMCRKCCGLQNCTTRLGTLNRAKVNSMSSIQEVQFRRGDLVVSRQSICSMDSLRLSCNSGDLIEVLEVNLDGTLLGRLSNLPGRTGLIPIDSVVRTSDTLRKCMSDRNSANRRSSHSVSEHGSDRPLSLVSIEIIKCNEDKNLEVSQQPWFFGELGREQANQLLESTTNGTFIVRHSTQQRQFVISLRYEGRGKHMKIEFCNENQQYYLHDGRMFDSIIDLVNFYRTNNLSEGFENLDVTLKGTPLKGNIYRALHDYRGSTPFKYLSMAKGDLVTVIDTAGESNGWWKGRISGPNFERTGFFPLSFVERVVEVAEPNIAESYTFSPNGARQPQHLLVASPSTEENEATL